MRLGVDSSFSTKHVARFVNSRTRSLSPQVRSEGEERVYVSEDWERQTWTADIRYMGTEVLAAM